MEVSVPLRGKGRDQRLTITSHTTMKVVMEVSVPLRGKGRDQLGSLPLWTRLRSSVFPSPCGEKVGINFTALGEQNGC